MRMMQAAMSRVHEGTQQDDLFYDHLSEKEDLWFDFMADTGDGGNSSYTVARCLLNRPFAYLERILCLRYHVGISYLLEEILRILIHQAWYKHEHIAVNKPELPEGVSELKEYDGPQCFLIPGNHDWFDGLHTFMRYICHKSWLGGWFMPQKRSYFALQLPKRWWVFGLDLSLHNDIDVYQFKFFSELVKNKVGENDSVIVMTHEPQWVLDWYWDDISGQNVSHLISDYLKGRCKLRIAGDMHHYMRHSCVPSECKAAYPSFHDSSRIALGNILKFRRRTGSLMSLVALYTLYWFSLRFHRFATIPPPRCDAGADKSVWRWENKRHFTTRLTYVFLTHGVVTQEFGSASAIVQSSWIAPQHGRWLLGFARFVSRCDVLIAELWAIHVGLLQV
ncbi:hypothetical protein GQ457_03G039710 [Hibiscus cannabinus]